MPQPQFRQPWMPTPELHSPTMPVEPPDDIVEPELPPTAPVTPTVPPIDFEQFDPSGYDFQNIFNQYQQEMPSFAMPDLSGYLTQVD